MFVFSEEVENVLQFDVLVFTNTPIPFITSTVSGVVNTQVLHGLSRIWRGMVGGVTDGPEYGPLIDHTNTGTY